jgi:hypothetical protein
VRVGVCVHVGVGRVCCRDVMSLCGQAYSRLIIEALLMHSRFPVVEHCNLEITLIVLPSYPAVCQVKKD